MFDPAHASAIVTEIMRDGIATRAYIQDEAIECAAIKASEIKP